MNRMTVKWLAVVASALMLVACAGQKEPATRAVADIEAAVASLRDDASKYAASELQQVEAGLASLKDSLAKGQNQKLAAYVAFRHLVTENSLKLLSSNQVDEVQEQWRTNLEAFARQFPNSEEAPEALLRLGLAHEYQKDRKEGETKAKATIQG